MNINGRLLLLAVVIGLFVRAWSTNDGLKRRGLARHRAAAVQTVALRNDRPAVQIVRVPAERDVTEVAGHEEHWTVANCPIPLPAGIVPGTYRVIDDQGRVARLTVVAEDMATQSSSQTQVETEFFMINAPQSRWYFVRLKTAPLAARTGAAPVASLSVAAVSTLVPPVESIEAAAPVANRKFDFSGYDAAEGETAPLFEQSSRPSPPELPSPL